MALTLRNNKQHTSLPTSSRHRSVHKLLLPLLIIVHFTIIVVTLRRNFNCFYCNYLYFQWSLKYWNTFCSFIYSFSSKFFFYSVCVLFTLFLVFNLIHLSLFLIASYSPFCVYYILLFSFLCLIFSYFPYCVLYILLFSLLCLLSPFLTLIMIPSLTGSFSLVYRGQRWAGVLVRWQGPENQLYIR